MPHMTSQHAPATYTQRGCAMHHNGNMACAVLLQHDSRVAP
jgi:hypothetical protein